MLVWVVIPEVGAQDAAKEMGGREGGENIKYIKKRGRCYKFSSQPGNWLTFYQVAGWSNSLTFL